VIGIKRFTHLVVVCIAFEVFYRDSYVGRACVDL